MACNRSLAKRMFQADEVAHVLYVLFCVIISRRQWAGSCTESRHKTASLFRLNAYIQKTSSISTEAKLQDEKTSTSTSSIFGWIFFTDLFAKIESWKLAHLVSMVFCVGNLEKNVRDLKPNKNAAFLLVLLHHLCLSIFRSVGLKGCAVLLCEPLQTLGFWFASLRYLKRVHLGPYPSTTIPAPLYSPLIPRHSVSTLQEKAVIFSRLPFGESTGTFLAQVRGHFSIEFFQSSCASRVVSAFYVKS